MSDLLERKFTLPEAVVLLGQSLYRQRKLAEKERKKVNPWLDALCVTKEGRRVPDARRLVALAKLARYAFQNIKAVDGKRPANWPDFNKANPGIGRATKEKA